ncbi:MAG: hypothetical protein Q8Q08_05335 [Candidatus Omnitrophota bacterium]|nr:hypothetical protein [Candidatus Omnitrophota bacterium]MDZ4242349.1 hypothetical protein [Candidatus Omnitrophota bacterium]
MKTVLIQLVILALTAVPALAGPGGKESRQGQKEEFKAHREQQRSENQAFRQSIQDLSPQERAKAIADHRSTQYQENKTFRGQKYQEHKARLQEKLAGNEKLTDAQRQDILNHYEQQYQENTSFRDQQHQENMSFLNSIAGNSGLTPEQIKDQMRAHFQAQRQENQTYRKQQREENKSRRGQMRSEFKNRNQNSEPQL